MTTSNIALSKLTVSDQNVRVVAPDKGAHQRLMASIASQGILQNLVVVPGKKNHFEVIAGGRRLKALQALAKQKTIPSDYPVPCLVKKEPGDITEISLAENVQHEAMLGQFPISVHWRGGCIDLSLYPLMPFLSC